MHPILVFSWSVGNICNGVDIRKCQLTRRIALHGSNCMHGCGCSVCQYDCFLTAVIEFRLVANVSCSQLHGLRWLMMGMVGNYFKNKFKTNKNKKETEKLNKIFLKTILGHRCLLSDVQISSLYKSLCTCL